MDRNEICCCEVRIWTKFIGWVQLAEYLFFILCLFAIVRFIDSLNLKDFQTAGLDVTEDQVGTIKPTLLIIYLVWVISGFKMAIDLLKGTYKKNLKKLDAWIKYVIICMTLDLLVSIGHAILTDGKRFGVFLCRFVFLQTWNVFCLLVVTTRKEEISKEIKSNSSVGHEEDV